MKLHEQTMDGYEFLAFKNANISQVEGPDRLLSSFNKRISISYSRTSTVKTYCRALRDISLFHGCLAQGLETDQILDYLHFLKEKGLSWAKIKLDAAGLKYFYREMAGDESLASSIPYPKEEKSLPLILSRKELLRLFDAAPNPKHRVILRLIYGSGLRRSELIRLRIRDIETDDGKNRIRVNKGKGGKDRYTVLSQKVLPELREYFKACRPKEYLFNGRKKGQPMSLGLLGYIMQCCLKRSGIQKTASLHTLRHCFASHALEDGMNIRSLQQLLGHSSIQSTMIYLHVSDVPLQGTFSPLDRLGSKAGKPALTLQHLLKNHLHELSLNSYEKRILGALTVCRTKALGGHTEACDSCGEVKVHYNSCGNRHCPMCQGANRERWLMEREYDLSDVPYQHVTFTVPSELRALFRLNEKLLYNALFRSMWGTLSSFSKDKRSRLQAQTYPPSQLHLV